MKPRASAPKTRANDLLQAGRDHGAIGYDVEPGLVRHRELVRLGTPPPDWAFHATSKSLLGLSQGALLTASAAAAVLSGVLVLAWLRHDASRDDLNDAADRATVEPSTTGAPEAVSADPDAGLHVAEPTGVPTDAAQAADASATAPSAGERRRARRSPPRNPRASIRSETRPQTPQSPSESQAPASPQPFTEQELQEMREAAIAEQLLEHNPARALQLARASEERFPRGYLKQERHYIVAMALWKLGRREEAEAEARAFLARYPSGPFNRRLRQALDAR